MKGSTVIVGAVGLIAGLIIGSFILNPGEDSAGKEVAMTATEPTAEPIRWKMASSFPGELAVIDGGLSAFFETPESAWEPVTDGAAGEFRSKKPFPKISGRAGSTNILGNFGILALYVYPHRYFYSCPSKYLLIGNTDIWLQLSLIHI